MGKSKFKVGDQIILEKVEDGWIAKMKSEDGELVEVDHHEDFKDILDFLEEIVIRN